MITKTVDTKLISLGEPKEIETDKTISAVFYDGQELEFTVPDSYVYLYDGVKTNDYGKKYVQIKSSQFSSFVDKVCASLDVTSPVYMDAFLRVTIGPQSHIRGSTSKIEDLEGVKRVKASVSIKIPSIYKDNTSGKTSCQVYIGSMIVHEVETHTLTVNLDKLTLAK